MRISIDRVRRDYLALLGESPGLSPTLDFGEDSAVLTLEEELETRLLPLAVTATLATPAALLDEIEEAVPTLLHADGGETSIRLPSDYLRLHSLKMMEWDNAVREAEPPDSLRCQLGASTPSWMACPRNPLVVERSDAKGRCLAIYGSGKLTPVHLLYVPLPEISDGMLRIQRAAYPRLLEMLTGADLKSPRDS